MKKMPSIFVRDWDGDRTRVLDEINPEAQWVFDGEGRPTLKLDGTCCLVRDGKLYRRRMVRLGHDEPADFEQVDIDNATGKRFGWIPVGDGPEDQWHREAWNYFQQKHWDAPDGTYEMIGPAIQSNPHKCMGIHRLWAHGYLPLVAITLKELAKPLTFETVKRALALESEIDTTVCEGFVWHHPDGRMAKIKRRDFGLPWPIK